MDLDVFLHMHAQWNDVDLLVLGNRLQSDFAYKLLVKWPNVIVGISTFTGNLYNRNMIPLC